MSLTLLERVAAHVANRAPACFRTHANRSPPADSPRLVLLWSPIPTVLAGRVDHRVQVLVPAAISHRADIQDETAAFSGGIDQGARIVDCLRGRAGIDEGKGHVALDAGHFADSRFARAMSVWSKSQTVRAFGRSMMASSREP